MKGLIPFLSLFLLFFLVLPLDLAVFSVSVVKHEQILSVSDYF